MNYGMGGLISSHVDSSNWLSSKNKDAEHNMYGGARFITFMIYLSDVLSGGRTGNTVQSRFSDTFGLCKNCH